MILTKNLTAKNIAVTAVAFVAALFSILSLVFSAVTATAKLWGETMTEGISGFKWLFGDETGSGWDQSVFSAILCLLVFLAAIAIIALFVASIVLAKDVATYRKGMRLVTFANCISAVVYLIAGIVAAASYSEFSNDYITYGTAAFVPLIIAVVLVAGYIVCDKMIPEAPAAEASTEE